MLVMEVTSYFVEVATSMEESVKVLSDCSGELCGRAEAIVVQRCYVTAMI